MLERAALTPLDISITDPDPKIPHSQHFIQSLLPSAPKWKRLHLNIREVQALMPVCRHLDNLEELSILCSHVHQYGSPFTLFEIAPALRSVEIIHSVAVDDDILELQLRWLTITDYMTDSADGDSALVVQLEPLTLCLNLFQAQLHEISKLVAEKVHRGTVLPNLDILSITTIEQGDLVLFLDKLKLPALNQLALDAAEGWNDADQESVRSLVARSDCSAPIFDLTDGVNEAVARRQY
ncbi:hypothetical protein C8J56DRAFT_1068097 [Mycena floridula]|nr:hypothetical protein C8J56DRAFT_1068097 [Mycena floridula]